MSLPIRWTSVLVLLFVLVLQRSPAQSPDILWRREIPLGHNEEFYYSLVVDRALSGYYETGRDRWRIEKRGLADRSLVDEWLLRETHYDDIGESRAPDLGDKRDRIATMEIGAFLVEEQVSPAFPSKLPGALRPERRDGGLILRSGTREFLVTGEAELSPDQSLHLGVRGFYRGEGWRFLVIHQGETVDMNYFQHVFPISEEYFRTIMYFTED